MSWQAQTLEPAVRRNRLREVSGLGIGEDRSAGCHHVAVNPVRHRDIPNSCRLAQTADPIDLDSEYFGQAIAGDSDRVLQGHQ